MAFYYLIGQLTSYSASWKKLKKSTTKKLSKQLFFCNCNCNCRCHGQLVHSSPKIFLNAFYAFLCFLYCNDDLNSLLKCLQTIYSHVILFDFLHAKLFSRLKNSYLNAKFGMEVANTHKNYMTSKTKFFEAESKLRMPITWNTRLLS